MMKRTRIRKLTKWIPRRWFFVMTVVSSTYILLIYILTTETRLVSRAENADTLAAGNLAIITKVQNEAVLPRQQTMVLPRVKHDGALPRQLTPTLSRVQNEAVLPRQPTLYGITSPSQKLNIPHLYFNEEGEGQNGIGVWLNKTDLTKQEQEIYDKGYEHNDFNEYVSNLISVDRRIPELRDTICQTQKYPNDLPDTSVVMCFLNEAWSVLVRSVHSVINTSPPHLLREIILVDDHSDYDYLKAPLDVYMKKFPKVKIIRNNKREGLIRSRLNGAKVATGQVLTFLDSHIECATDWLTPLLARIKENSSHVVCPAIGLIDRDTFAFTIQKTANINKGVFDWTMTFIWESPNILERENVASPIKSPTMAGGLFSVDREYFYHIGSYDEEMLFWGGENLEISFRIWMCGGTLEIIPCSVVGHVFRKRNVNAHSAKAVNVIANNTVRMAMVWLDKYKYLYAKASGVKLENFGDISRRLELREKLKCKSFEWYLTNVYPSVFRPENALSGMIHTVTNSSKCLKASIPDKTIIVSTCNKWDHRQQLFFMTQDEEIRLLSNCLDAGEEHPIMFFCHKLKGRQQFIHRQDKSIFNPVSGKCLEWKEGTSGLEMLPCYHRNPRQQWELEKISLDFFKKTAQIQFL